MKNPVTWFEIMGKDSAALQKFYRDVFGWKLTPPAADMGNYAMLAEHGPGQAGSGGGIGEGDARISVYVEVDDPQQYVDRATRAGATVLMPVTTITPTTTIAMLSDPAGNTFGVMKAGPRPVKTTARKKTTGRAKTAAKRTRKTTTRRTTARKRTTRRGRRSR
jgi:predicted enzyme related to lactoylglutathione lyase